MTDRKRNITTSNWELALSTIFVLKLLMINIVRRRKPVAVKKRIDYIQQEEEDAAVDR